MHIVIVEDDVVIRQELKLLLENALYQVTALSDFSDVASYVLDILPDLVLLDLNLPEESGFDICTKIRAGSEVPVIFVTSRTDSMDELTGILKGGGLKEDAAGNRAGEYEAYAQRRYAGYCQRRGGLW